MQNKLFGILAIAATVVTLAAPLAAQTTRLTATIPFEFSVSGKTMPAGNYALYSDESRGLLRVSGMDSNVLALTRPVEQGEPSRPGQILLIFSKLGNHYALSQIWSGYETSGRQVPETTTERELARTATMQKYEIRALLARR